MGRVGHIQLILWVTEVIFLLQLYYGSLQALSPSSRAASLCVHRIICGARSRSLFQKCLLVVHTWPMTHGVSWSGDAHLARVVAGVKKFAPESSAQAL